jgi:hypothetical protein
MRTGSGRGRLDQRSRLFAQQAAAHQIREVGPLAARERASLLNEVFELA